MLVKDCCNSNACNGCYVIFSLTKFEKSILNKTFALEMFFYFKVGEKTVTFDFNFVAKFYEKCIRK